MAAEFAEPGEGSVDAARGPRSIEEVL
jgi:hypothetical protein